MRAAGNAQGMILISEPLEPNVIETMRRSALKLGFEVRYETRESAVAERIPETEVFFGLYPADIPIPGSLKWICLPSAGINGYTDLPAIRDGRCLLTYSSGAYGITIGEHLVMLVLMLLRRMPEYLADAREGIWRHDRKLRSIYGSRIVILGTGDIGSAFAARARSFGPRSITGISRSGRSSCDCYDRMLAVSELDRVLPEADILVMALPETPDTIHILNRQRIEKLPPQALVVNVGRGSAIDEKALADALRSRRIAGAALDVFETEPLPADDALRGIDSLIITPHMAGQRTLDESVRIITEKFLDDLARYSRGERLLNLADLARGY